MATPTKYARIKPFNPRRKHLLRTYHLGIANAEGVLQGGAARFEERRGWYPVTEAVAQRLAQIHQIESDPDSPLAFDVVNSLEEARTIDAREKAEVDRAAGRIAPNDLSTTDVAETRRPEPRIPAAQREIRRGVRDPRERATRPATEERERA